VFIPTKHLRPALSIRILSTDFTEDHTVYVIWVVDVKTGAEWNVRRRFREFYEFRERLQEIRSGISRLPFPPRRPSLSETVALVNERQVIQ
jgi:hypothetical protein